METPPDNGPKPPLSAAGWITLAILAGFFGTDNVDFVAKSENPAVTDRPFTSFSQAAQESAAE